MAANFTMYCLEQITDYFAFERLCHDLMVLEGYSSIEPLGGFSDKGRDAIHVSQSRETTIFAYSVREDWRKKLEEDAEKIYKHRHTCDQIVFMTTAEFTGGERDRAVQDIRDKFSWTLQLFGAERLRILLETKHPEIKENHPQIFPPLFLNNQSELNRLSEHFTKAVEQLANPEITVRLGGIYALERIAKKSKDDHWTIMEVLTAFVREKRRLKEEGEREQLPKIPTDIQAALTVIGRRNCENETENQRLDLHNTDIGWADLRGANLKKVILIGANLEGSNLTEEADLEESYLHEANLKEAYLIAAKMERAILQKANLQQASLERAELARADLSEAELQGANLNGAKLQGANLIRAKLQGAKLSKANLQGAVLYQAKLERPFLDQTELEKTNHSKADLKRTFLDQAKLEETNLSEANLEGAVLYQAHLKGANLSGANLQGAILNEANLQGANLNSAKLEAANLSGAKNLQQEQIDKAFGDKITTRLPEYLKAPEHWTESN